MLTMDKNGIFVEELSGMTPNAHGISLLDKDGVHINLSREVALSVIMGMVVLYNQMHRRDSGAMDINVGQLLHYFGGDVAPKRKK